MEIAENITWTEELERLDVLLSQGQFELLLPGERYGGGEKEIWLVYLMNDAAESFLVFHDAELTGNVSEGIRGRNRCCTGKRRGAVRSDRAAGRDGVHAVFQPPFIGSASV